MRYFELSAAPWKDGSRMFTTAILRDVDDRRAAEAALRESERQSRANEKALAALNKALEETSGQLRAMDQRRNEFLRDAWPTSCAILWRRCATACSS